MRSVWRFFALYFLPMALLLLVFHALRDTLGLPEFLAAALALLCASNAFDVTAVRLSPTPQGAEVFHFVLRLWLAFAFTFGMGGAFTAVAFCLGLPEWWAAAVGAVLAYGAFPRLVNHLVPDAGADPHLQGRRPPVFIPIGKRQERFLLRLFTRPAPPKQTKGDPDHGPASRP